jgi:hypothetical protein
MVPRDERLGYPVENPGNRHVEYPATYPQEIASETRRTRPEGLALQKAWRAIGIHTKTLVGRRTDAVAARRRDILRLDRKGVVSGDMHDKDALRSSDDIPAKRLGLGIDIGRCGAGLRCPCC